MEEPGAPEANKQTFLQYLPDLFFAPGEALASVVRHPGFLVPLAVLVALALVFTAVWTQNMDAEEFVRGQIEASGRAGDLSAEQLAPAVELQLKIFPIMVWVGAVIGSPIAILLVSGVLLFMFRFFFASEVGFKESMAVTAHSFMTVSLIQTPLTLLTMALKEDWNLNPQDTLGANLSLLFDKAETPAALWAFAGSVDLFSFWTIFLLSVGFGLASRRSASSAAIGVLIPWALYVALKVGAAALFG